MAENTVYWDPRWPWPAEDILERAKLIAPDLRIQVKWLHDPYFRWDGDGPDPKEEGYAAYDVYVVVHTAVFRTEYRGEDHLGGAYEKPELPKDPEIHGYFLQMLMEAVKDLEGQLEDTVLNYRKIKPASPMQKKYNLAVIGEAKGALGQVRKLLKFLDEVVAERAKLIY